MHKATCYPVSHKFSDNCGAFRIIFVPLQVGETPHTDVISNAQNSSLNFTDTRV